MRNLRRQYYTLLELTVVITILVLLTAVSTAYISNNQKGSELQRALQDFQVFCARARSASMSDNSPRKIVFYPQDKLFRIEKAETWLEGSSVISVEEAESGAEAYVVLEVIEPEDEYTSEGFYAENDKTSDGYIRKKYLQWQFPESLDLNFDLPVFEGVEIHSESVELWRYTRGGAARMSCELTVQMGSDTYTFTVSELSGMLNVVENREDEGRRVW